MVRPGGTVRLSVVSRSVSLHQMRLRYALVIVALLAASCSSGTRVLEITDSWAPTTPPGAQAAVVYLTIANGTSDDDRLLAVSSERCGAIELHATQFDDQRIMRMRLAEPELLAIPSGATLQMVPGGLHVMCIDPPTPFRAGEMLSLTVTLEKAGLFEIATPVENR
jgi:copper(I)-binding protein